MASRGGIVSVYFALSVFSNRHSAAFLLLPETEMWHYC